MRTTSPGRFPVTSASLGEAAGLEPFALHWRANGRGPSGGGPPCRYGARRGELAHLSRSYRLLHRGPEPLAVEESWLECPALNVMQNSAHLVNKRSEARPPRGRATLARRLRRLGSGIGDKRL